MSKRDKLLVEAYHSGTLLVEEQTDRVMRLVEEADKKQATQATRRAAGLKRVREKVDGGTLPKDDELARHSVFLSEHIGDAKKKKVLDKCAKVGASITSNRLQATIYVTDDPSNPGGRIKWAAALAGRLVMSPEAICTKVGVCLGYVAAVKVRRQIYFGDAFREAFPKLVKTVLALQKRVATKWTVVNDKQDFVDRKVKAIQCKHSPEVVALLAKSELQEHYDLVKRKLKATIASKFATAKEWPRDGKQATKFII